MSKVSLFNPTFKGALGCIKPRHFRLTLTRSNTQEHKQDNYRLELCNLLYGFLLLNPRLRSLLLFHLSFVSTASSCVCRCCINLCIISPLMQDSRCNDLHEVWLQYIMEKHYVIKKFKHIELSHLNNIRLYTWIYKDWKRINLWKHW